MTSIFTSSQSTEYHTPSTILEAARQAMGGIDLDPASSDKAQKNVRATTYYTKKDDGLSLTWHGRVFLNPPFGTTKGKSNAGIWSQYLIAQYEANNTTQAILITKAAFGSQWFNALWHHWPVCIPDDKISYHSTTAKHTSKPFVATVIFYLGPNVDRFIAAFKQFGRIIMPNTETRA